MAAQARKDAPWHKRYLLPLLMIQISLLSTYIGITVYGLLKQKNDHTVTKKNAKVGAAILIGIFSFGLILNGGEIMLLATQRLHALTLLFLNLLKMGTALVLWILTLSKFLKHPWRTPGLIVNGLMVISFSITGVYAHKLRRPEPESEAEGIQTSRPGPVDEHLPTYRESRNHQRIETFAQSRYDGNNDTTSRSDLDIELESIGPDIEVAPQSHSAAPPNSLQSENDTLVPTPEE